ncbi:polyubiquitin-B [Artemisia annua]|uniref:Polyubiquitin-B n=1 Tax=Artemisia annua TaxID=35608 RepID=A0A2U1L8U8_ARTAN|nr:polyubiquitin-B [Artemisia annua]
MANYSSSRKRMRHADSNSDNLSDFEDDEINNIYVKTHNGNILSLKVESSDTIFDVKAKIRDIIGIPHDEQALIFNATILEDSVTLAYFYIKNDSTITLMLKSSGLVPIFINRQNGMRLCSLKVKLSDTIGNVKAKIPHIDCDYEALIFNEMVLDESCALADFNIKNGSTLTLMRKSMTPMKIFIKTLTRMTISLYVKPSDTIGKVKTELESWHRDHIVKPWDRIPIDKPKPFPIDKQVLIFDEMVLDDRGSLLDFQIKNGSTLTLMRKSRRLLHIFVKTNNGKTFSIEVNPLDTVANLKARLNDEEDMPVPSDQQVLIFEGRRLKDNHTLSEYNIQNESILDCMFTFIG